MSRITDLAAIAIIARHCTEPGCGKCAARSRWSRRKGRRPGNNPSSRKSTERK
jgi:hypothetical protein